MSENKMYGTDGINKENIGEFLEELARPFPATDVRFRIGGRPYNGKARVFSYIDSRKLMDRFDALAGPFWEVTYSSHPGTEGVLCTIRIMVAGKWISRSDGAGVGRGNEGSQEGVAEKGTLTDAFKRACVAWGPGRELYEWPVQKVEVNTSNQIIECPTFPTELYGAEEIKLATERWEKENGWKKNTKQSKKQTPTTSKPRRSAKKASTKKEDTTIDPEVMARAEAFVVPAGLPMEGDTLKNLESPFIKFFAGQVRNNSGAYFTPETEEESKLQAAAKYILRRN